MAGVTLSFNVLFLRVCLLLVEIQFLLRISSCIDPGFSADIIHRDSPESPLYDPSSTPWTRLQAAVNRSAFRMNYLRRARFPDFIAPPPGPLRDGLSNPLYNYKFEFLMSFYIGSNGKRAFVGINTGNAYTWVLCKPCRDCYKPIAPIFNPNTSITYDKLNCSIRPCTFHSNSSCDSEGKCEYVINYHDKSIAKGILSTETLGFNSIDEKKIYHLQHIILGCTHETQGNFLEGGIGMVGLNRGVLSLISQIGPTFGRRFSYCLPHLDEHRSQFFFGAAAIVSGHGVMSTPLLNFLEDQYGLLLTTIKVGKEEPIILRLPQNKLDGNIMIDSATVLTYLEPMPDIIKKVKKHIPLNTKFVPHYDLCFDTRGHKKGYQLPKITLKFFDDGEFVISGKHAFSQIDDTTMCLLIASTSHTNGIQIFGNLAQLGYRIEYDIENFKLNFRKDEDCSTKYIHARDD